MNYLSELLKSLDIFECFVKYPVISGLDFEQMGKGGMALIDHFTFLFIS